jgi:tRNA(Arg) A34 adenosine deaminase TadA
MNHVVASHDPTWHGEMEAIRSACITLQSFKLTGCILYTSAEPCPMCMAACYWAGLEHVYYAATVDDAAKYGNFDDRPIYEQLALPKEKRSIKFTQLLRNEAIKVWKKYQKKPNRIHY